MRAPTELAEWAPNTDESNSLLSTNLLQLDLSRASFRPVGIASHTTVYRGADGHAAVPFGSLAWTPRTERLE